MSTASDFRTYLQQELVRRCQANPSYSMRAFARTLGMDASTLAKILNGKRAVGARTIRSLSLKLGLKGVELERFIACAEDLEAGNGRSAQASMDEYQQLSLDHFAIISDWYHMAILELMTVEDFRADMRWVAKALGITVSEVRLATERLVRVGLLKIDSKGRWLDTSSGRTTNIAPDMTTEALRRLQKQILEKAIAALEDVPLAERDQTTITMAIDRSKLPEAKERIKKFRRGLAKFLCRTGRRDEVYNLSISLYPLTQLHERKKS